MANFYRDEGTITKAFNPARLGGMLDLPIHVLSRLVAVEALCTVPNHYKARKSRIIRR